MLLVQCEETERLQQELDDMQAELEELQRGYERLKKKLDIKDERLNQKDANIAELKQRMEEMQASRLIELNEAGSIAEASLRLNGIFEAAQRAAEQYLMNVKRLSGELPDHIENGYRTLPEEQGLQENRPTGQKTLGRPAELTDQKSMEQKPVEQGLIEMTEQGVSCQPEILKQPAVSEKRPAAGMVNISERLAARGQKISYESGWRQAGQRKKLHG